MNISDLKKKIQTCKNCDLGKSQKKRVPGTGSENPIVLFLGESPGRREVESGEAFSGPISEVIDKVCVTLDLTKEQIWKTNVIKCPTPDYRNPYDREIRACEVLLKDEIHVLKPKVILAMGRVPAFFVTGSRKTVNEQRRKIHYFSGIPCIITFHPSAVKRFPFLEAHLLEDLELFQKIELGKSSIFNLRKQLEQTLRDKS